MVVQTENPKPSVALSQGVNIRLSASRILNLLKCIVVRILVK